MLWVSLTSKISCKCCESQVKYLAGFLTLSLSFKIKISCKCSCQKTAKFVFIHLTSYIEIYKTLHDEKIAVSLLAIEKYVYNLKQLVILPEKKDLKDTKLHYTEMASSWFFKFSKTEKKLQKLRREFLTSEKKDSFKKNNNPKVIKCKFCVKKIS